MTFVRNSRGYKVDGRENKICVEYVPLCWKIAKRIFLLVSLLYKMMESQQIRELRIVQVWPSSIKKQTKSFTE